MGPIAFVIEDDEDIGEIYSAAIRAAQYRPIHIRNGLEALEKLKNTIPKLVILDLHIPKLNGMTVLRAIRSDTRMTGSMIIIVTADAILAEGLQNVADAVLVKPVGFTQIRELAERYLQMTTPIIGD